MKCFKLNFKSYYALFLWILIFFKITKMVIIIVIQYKGMVKVINNYTLIQKIGEGEFGQVYRAINSKKIGEFAVKIIPVQKIQQNQLLEECTINQVQTLQAIGNQQYIVRFQQNFQTKNNYYFVYQYCNGGTLLDAIKRQGPFPQKRALSIFRQILQAFKVLNRYNIMHRDLKPQNIFLSNGRIKLGDFGFCKGLKPGENMAKTMLGSPIYMAPQVLRGQTYTTKADIWSLGVVLFQMLFSVCPFQSNSIASLISHINSSQLIIPLQKNRIQNRTQTLIRKLLTKDYFRRISWIQLFQYRIDEEGNYIENDQYTISSSKNTSFSVKQSDSSKRQNNKVNKTAKDGKDSQLSVKKFYSEKYMNAVTQPIVIENKNTQKKIDYYTDYNHTGEVQSQELKSIQGIVSTSKRARLIHTHEECLNNLKDSLKDFQKNRQNALESSFMALQKVHRQLKDITEQIRVTQTQLLDIASLINIEIIQIDRQMIDIKQQLVKRKIKIPKDRPSSRTVEGPSSAILPDVGIYTSLDQAPQ